MKFVGRQDDRDLSKLETLMWDPSNSLQDPHIDQFLVIARCVINGGNKMPLGLIESHTCYYLAKTSHFSGCPLVCILYFQPISSLFIVIQFASVKKSQ